MSFNSSGGNPLCQALDVIECVEHDRILAVLLSTNSFNQVVIFIDLKKTVFKLNVFISIKMKKKLQCIQYV